MKPIRIAIVDDDTVVRACTRMLCGCLDGVTVVAEANDGDKALEMVKEHQPDIVLMDITMKAMNGLEATAQIKRELPQMRVVILSLHKSEDYVRQALRVGASGYLIKDEVVLELKTAITTVMRGEIYLSPPILKLVAQG